MQKQNQKRRNGSEVYNSQTNELELNRWAHKFMGYCLSRNEDCGCTPRDYTTDLNLASIVEAKAIEMVGYESYIVALVLLAPYRGFCAPALTRVEAARRAVEAK